MCCCLDGIRHECAQQALHQAHEETHDAGASRRSAPTPACRQRGNAAPHASVTLERGGYGHVVHSLYCLRLVSSLGSPGNTLARAARAAPRLRMLVSTAARLAVEVRSSAQVSLRLGPASFRGLGDHGAGASPSTPPCSALVLLLVGLISEVALALLVGLEVRLVPPGALQPEDGRRHQSFLSADLPQSGHVLSGGSENLLHRFELVSAFLTLVLVERHGRPRRIGCCENQAYRRGKDTGAQARIQALFAGLRAATGAATGATSSPSLTEIRIR